MVSLPPCQDFFGSVQRMPDSPPQTSNPGSTLNCIVIDRDWSGRTFSIPDCPSKDTIGSLKGWYIRNICPSAQPSSLIVLRKDTGAQVSDETPFWQLAEGEASFNVIIAHAESKRRSDEPVSLWVQHESTGISTSVTLSPKSTLLQLKIASFEQLALGDQNAALDPRVCFSFNGHLLDNESTVHAASLSNGDRLFLLERSSPPSSHRTSPVGDRRSHSLISDIWANSDYISSSEDEDLTLPAALLADDLYDGNQNSQPRGSRRKQREKQQFCGPCDLAKTRSTYRTKMCRVGAAACKYGASCWFAHTQEELRKPSDPLPPHCPGVSKLEKYTKRQDNH